MIRDATPADVPALLNVGERFAAKADLVATVGFCRDSLAATLGNMIDAHIVLVTPNVDACIGGVVYVHPFNAAHVAVQELFWWSEGRRGMELLHALEQAARDRGARSLTMLALDAVHPAAMGRLYTRAGFAPLERSYMKGL